MVEKVKKWSLVVGPSDRGARVIPHLPLFNTPDYDEVVVSPGEYPVGYLKPQYVWHLITDRVKHSLGLYSSELEGPFFELAYELRDSLTAGRLMREKGFAQRWIDKAVSRIISDGSSIEDYWRGSSPKALRECLNGEGLPCPEGYEKAWREAVVYRFDDEKYDEEDDSSFLDIMQRDNMFFP